MKREYFSLYWFIPEAFEKFSFSNYYEDEQRYLKPALEAKGYTFVQFMDGERDSFGPLSRVAICRIAGDKGVTYYVYG